MACSLRCGQTGWCGTGVVCDNLSCKHLYAFLFVRSLLAKFIEKNASTNLDFPVAWTQKGLHYQVLVVFLLHLADLKGIRTGPSSGAVSARAKVDGYCAGTTLVNFLRGLQILHHLRGFTLCPSVRRGLHGFITRTLKRAVSGCACIWCRGLDVSGGQLTTHIQFHAVPASGAACGAGAASNA